MTHKRYDWCDGNRSKCRWPNVVLRQSSHDWTKVDCERCLKLRNCQGSKPVRKFIAELNREDSQPKEKLK